MSSGPSGKNITPRRSVSSEHWDIYDVAATQLGDVTAVALVRRLIGETINDTRAAKATCERIIKAVARG